MESQFENQLAVAMSEPESAVRVDTPTITLNRIVIMARKEDCYVNATALCQAGYKEFKHWFTNKRSKKFREVLSASVGIPTDRLITYCSGSNSERATYVHPMVAINIVQWISPEFDVQVSKWIYELGVYGKVDLQNEHKVEQIDRSLITKLESELANEQTKCIKLNDENNTLKETIETQISHIKNQDDEINDRDMKIKELTDFNKKEQDILDILTLQKFNHPNDAHVYRMCILKTMFIPNGTTNRKPTGCHNV
jgi:hypothetical protein